MKRQPPSTPSNPFAELSEAWVSSWMQPWSAWQTWSKLWENQWQHWFDAAAAVPSPWLPALADERRHPSVAIDFFLPWAPRQEVEPEGRSEPAVHDAVATMLRAAAPTRVLTRVVGDIVATEAKVQAVPAVVEPSPAPKKPARKASTAKRPAKPAAAAVAAAAKAPEPVVEVPAAKPARSRRSGARKPAAETPKAD